MGRKLSDFGEGGGVEVEELRSRRRVGEEARETGRVAGGEEAVRFDRGEKMFRGSHGGIAVGGYASP